jgi:hypothetical protein
VTAKKPRSLTLHLPPLTAATAAALWDLCGSLQEAIWREYGEQLDQHWQAEEPGQPVYGKMSALNNRKR